MIVDLNHFKTATAMMTVSHYHEDYTDQDIRNFIEPPLSLGNYLIIQDEDDLDQLKQGVKRKAYDSNLTETADDEMGDSIGVMSQLTMRMELRGVGSSAGLLM